MMQKTDLTQQYKSYYTAKLQPELVEIENARFISITGKGDPSEKMYADKIQALYATAYTVKFSYKTQQKDFIVAKLEGLWWFDAHKYSGVNLYNAPTSVPRSEWEYRMLIRMPEFVSTEDIQSAAQTVVTKKQLLLAHEVVFFQFSEGKSVQMLHVGPFDQEPETLKKMHAFMQAYNLERNGLRHEIYLSDLNRTSPGKLRTILRELVK